MGIEELKEFDVDVQTEALLSEYTTFRLGGRCPCIITCQRPEQLEQVVQHLYREKTNFILMGRGSNLVVSDQGVECVVIRYLSDKPFIEQNGTDVTVSGSTHLDDLTRYAAEHGLEGINFTSGIPGTVGGAIAGNAGAFGGQIGDRLKSVLLISKAGVKREVGPEELALSYRNSLLKKNGEIVLSATFSLQKGDKDTLLRLRREMIKWRQQKQPDLVSSPSAGCIFRNIESTRKDEKRQAAGLFLEEAGAKSLRQGGAAVFDKHANMIVKQDHGTAQNVYELSRKMAELVKEKYNLQLIREVCFVGKFEGMPEDILSIVW